MLTGSIANVALVSTITYARHTRTLLLMLHTLYLLVQIARQV